MINLPETKTYDTYMVASALTGIGMGPCNYTDMMDVYSMLLGEEVWTHEIAHAPTVDAVRQEGLLQFPLMPLPEFAEQNWEAALDKAISAYGHFVTVKRGNHKRREGPIATLNATVLAAKKGLKI
jgi:hypothetical protein